MNQASIEPLFGKDSNLAIEMPCTDNMCPRRQMLTKLNFLSTELVTRPHPVTLLHHLSLALMALKLLTSLTTFKKKHK